ncbi:right-handed parallel beta-helix repeat-containing protein [Paraflavisolibacter sp. H34]|uniref:right-handed parallel beta-helix repeat-containing protein n=1 Tax=Huijunlia imazamoxiresistens TaxID=3127457 RepID=UPI003016D9A0
MIKMLTTLLLLLSFQGYAQNFVTKDIKSFGARGDGKTNDHAAFEKAAAFFNSRGGNGRLVISRGTYLIGKQDFTQGAEGKPAYLGYDALLLTGVRNLIIEGKDKARVVYADSLRFGAFNPQTGQKFSNSKYFTKYAWAATIGHFINLRDCREVEIKNLELDGNLQGTIRGGVYGDKGIQLPHTALFIWNSKKVTVSGINAHHFALDGISVGNKETNTKDEIKILNSVFEYNGRQGLSWIGGNDLLVKDSKFNHTGQAGFFSPPGAGVDIEAERGPITNGRFENCEFINNRGVGMVADNGPSRNCTFKKCTFWGTKTWSIWVNRPAFTFTDCKIYGSFVHGYKAETDADATRFIGCHFEDKPYEGKLPYGNFLVESNGRKRVSFRDCSFVSNTKKLVWIQASAAWAPEEKYQFDNCRFSINNDSLPRRDFVAVVRGMRYKNCTFNFTKPEAKQKKYYLNSCCENYNVDEGGNKVVYADPANAGKP